MGSQLALHPLTSHYTPLHPLTPPYTLLHPITPHNTPLQVAWAVNLAAACGCLGGKGASAEATQRRREAKGSAAWMAKPAQIARRGSARLQGYPPPPLGRAWWLWVARQHAQGVMPGHWAHRAESLPRELGPTTASHCPRAHRHAPPHRPWPCRQGGQGGRQVHGGQRGQGQELDTVSPMLSERRRALHLFRPYT